MCKVWSRYDVSKAEAVLLISKNRYPEFANLMQHILNAIFVMWIQKNMKY